MHNLKIFEYHTWNLASFFGIEHPFLVLHADTIIYTWITLLGIFLLALIGRISLAYPHSLLGYFTISSIRMLMGAIKQSFGVFVYRYFFFITALFCFILIANMLLIIPGCEEPTKDLNTTLALGIISFGYTQKETLRILGWREYVQEYMKFPFSFISLNVGYLFIPTLLYNILVVFGNSMVGIITLPLEVLSKLATIISLSFRLFGNIFGGSMIFGLWQSAISGSILYQLVGISLSLLIMAFFGLFESFIQAFVFSILSLTYLAMAVQHGNIAPEELLHD
jgi:F-type H+-transporting ATPase subunit a